MASLPVIVLALVPVAFVILLGALAGRLGVIGRDGSRVLASLALDFCLPALLFAATATMPMTELENWRFFLGVAIGLLAICTAALPFCHQVRDIGGGEFAPGAEQRLPEHGLHGRAGADGGDRQVSGAVGRDRQSGVELCPAAADPDAARGRKGADQGRGRREIRRRGPHGRRLEVPGRGLQAAPGLSSLVGVAIAVLKLPMPEVAIRSLDLIRAATSGVALFALGLVLSGQRLSIGAAVLTNAAFKMLAQPAVMALLAFLLGVTGTYRREMILLGALPTASMTAMFAVEYEVYVAQSEATILLSTVLSLVTLGVCIALTA